MAFRSPPTRGHCLMTRIEAKRGTQGSASAGTAMWLQGITGGGIEGLVYGPDGKHLYSNDAGGTVISWDTKLRGYKKLFKVDPLPGRGGGRAAGLFVAGGGRYLVLRLELPLVWDLKKDAA